MKKLSTAFVVFTMLAAVILTPIAANAQASQSDVYLDTAHPYHPPRVVIKEGTSSNWSGYSIFTSSSSKKATSAVSSVYGSWIVPTVMSTSVDAYSAAWVGIDGYNTNSVEQIGTEQDWIGGKAVYYVWYEMYPKPSYLINVPIASGDSITASVVFSGKNTYTLTISDANQPWRSVSIKQTANAPRQSAEWIMEAPWSGGVLPLANFGKVSFSGCGAVVDSSSVPVNYSSSPWSFDQINMASGSTTKATTSGTSSKGSSFSINFNHS